MYKAKSVGKELQSLAESIAKKHGAKTTPLNLKGYESIKRKVEQDKNNKGVSGIKDLVRTTIIADTDEHEAILKELGTSPYHLKTKHQSREDYGGYEGNISNVRIKGVTGEIQVVSPEMIYAKGPANIALKILGKKKFQEIRKRTGEWSGQGHAYYEFLRKQKGEGKRHPKMSDQKNYYKKFK